MSPAALAERKRLQQEFDRDDKMETKTAVHADAGDAGDEINLGPSDADGAEGADTVHVPSSEGIRPCDGPQDQVCTPCTAVGSEAVHEFVPIKTVTSTFNRKMLQSGATSLLRFLMSVCIRQAPPSPRRQSHEQNAGERATLPDGARTTDERLRAAKAQKSTLSPLGDAAGTTKSSTGAEVPLAPTRQRSTYGTPLSLSRMHVDSLHKVEWAVTCHASRKLSS